MSPTPLVSVVIPTHNAVKYIGEAVQSAISQTYPRMEILVVDDGSTDETEQMLRSLRDRITYIKQANRGPAAARNTAIRQANGELIAFLDSDDVWNPDKVAEQVAHLLARPQCALVHCDLLYRENNSRSLTSSVCDRGQFVGNCYRNLFFSNHIVPSTVLMLRDVAVQLGLFDEACEIQGCEDYDLWMRVARWHDVGYLPHSLTIYRRHEANISRNQLRMARAELLVVQNALRKDPTLVSLIGQDRVDRRLHDLYSFLGYLQWDAGNLAAARSYFRQALHLKPNVMYSRAVWCATYLPEPWVKWARKLKQNLTGRPHRSGLLSPDVNGLSRPKVEARHRG
jgi:glycosyltransferase involved in cell wall biosynthesis